MPPESGSIVLTVAFVSLALFPREQTDAATYPTRTGSMVAHDGATSHLSGPTIDISSDELFEAFVARKSKTTNEPVEKPLDGLDSTLD
eukprot:5540888-Amphidinium_carterae.1